MVTLLIEKKYLEIIVIKTHVLRSIYLKLIHALIQSFFERLPINKVFYIYIYNEF